MKSVIRTMMGFPLWLHGIGAATHVSLGRVASNVLTDDVQQPDYF